MKLANPFPLWVRNMYLYEHACLLCGANGQGRGGFELHHILGRVSGSPFNAALLCGECHKGMVHNRDEHQLLGGLQLRWLRGQKYVPSEDDWVFLMEHYEELVARETESELGLSTSAYLGTSERGSVE